MGVWPFTVAPANGVHGWVKCSAGRLFETRQTRKCHRRSLESKNCTTLGDQSHCLIEGILHMSFHTFRTLQSLGLFAVLLASHSIVSAQEPSQSLQERRLGILKGTATGIVIYNFQPSTASVPTSVPSDAATKPSAEQATQAPSKSGFLSTLQPPSGRSLSNANRLGAVDGGIPLPTARTASESPAAPVAKP